jgi:hypothetical protein
MWIAHREKFRAPNVPTTGLRPRQRQSRESAFDGQAHFPEKTHQAGYWKLRQLRLHLLLRNATMALRMLRVRGQ